MAEAALVLAAWSSVQMLFELGLRFNTVLKPAQNEVPEKTDYKNTTKRPHSDRPHHSLHRR